MLAKYGKVPFYVNKGALAPTPANWAIIDDGMGQEIVVRTKSLPDGPNAKGMEGVSIDWLGEIPFDRQLQPVEYKFYPFE